MAQPLKIVYLIRVEISLQERPKLSLMRKIEQQMIDAIKGNENWSSGNTQVVTNLDLSNVYLHGNLIAQIDNNTVTIFDGGHQSKTTKSRLNVFARNFCIAGELYSRKIFSGMFVSSSDVLTDKMSTRPKISPTVMYSPEG